MAHPATLAALHADALFGSYTEPEIVIAVRLALAASTRPHRGQSSCRSILVVGVCAACWRGTVSSARLLLLSCSLLADALRGAEVKAKVAAAGQARYDEAIARGDEANEAIVMEQLSLYNETGDFESKIGLGEIKEIRFALYRRVTDSLGFRLGKNVRIPLPLIIEDIVKAVFPDSAAHHAGFKIGP